MVEIDLQRSGTPTDWPWGPAVMVVRGKPREGFPSLGVCKKTSCQLQDMPHVWRGCVPEVNPEAMSP